MLGSTGGLMSLSAGRPANAEDVLDGKNIHDLYDAVCAESEKFGRLCVNLHLNVVKVEPFFACRYEYQYRIEFQDRRSIELTFHSGDDIRKGNHTFEDFIEAVRLSLAVQRNPVPTVEELGLAKQARRAREAGEGKYE